MITEQAKALRDRWMTIKQQQPKLRIRDCAAELDVSEAELLATGVGDHVICLSHEFTKILMQLEELGPVMALTRNHSVVHERHGIYRSARMMGDSMALFVNDDIDLRIFLSHWAFGFAVTERGHHVERKSLQFFDNDGQAVHKIYLTEDSDHDAYQRLVDQFASTHQSCELLLSDVSDQRFNTPDESIDHEAFQAAWDGLQDTHDFFPLLKEFKLDRLQALHLAGRERSRELVTQALAILLRQASQAELEIMVFVASRGVIQIHTGLVKHIAIVGDWLNVLDPEFNLHIRETDIDSCWAVAKPSSDGQVTSVECFDAQGNLVVQFFGKRKPGQKENPFWRALVESLPTS